MMAWMEGMNGIFGPPLRVEGWRRVVGCVGVGLGWDWIAVCQGLRSLISPTAGGFARCFSRGWIFVRGRGATSGALAGPDSFG